jgi:hypothetical protein
MMPMKTTTYARFKRLLESLGLRYERRPAANGKSAAHIYYEPDGQPLMIFPEYRPNQLVRPHHLVAMRRLLDEFGYMEREDFERFLEHQKETA